MVNNVTVAWATPVDPFILGAQVEAYTESKAPISTFQLCVKYAGAHGKALGRLPPELVENVVGHIRRAIVEQRLRHWQKMELCCKDECSAFDHYSEEELLNLREEYFDSRELCCPNIGCTCKVGVEYGNPDYTFEEFLLDEGPYCEIHYENMINFLSMIEEEEGP